MRDGVVFACVHCCVAIRLCMTSWADFEKALKRGDVPNFHTGRSSKEYMIQGKQASLPALNPMTAVQKKLSLDIANVGEMRFQFATLPPPILDPGSKEMLEGVHESIILPTPTLWLSDLGVAPL